METKADGERVHQVFQRDAAGRISKITTVPAGATAPGRPTKSQGGFLPKPTMTVAEQDAWQKSVHKAAWTTFVKRKYAR